VTPEAVIYRYLEAANQQPFAAADFVRVLGADADLLGRWLNLLECRADPAALTDVIEALSGEHLRNLAQAIPYQIHTVLTDNGVQFCHPGRYRDGPTATLMGHLFDRVCAEHGIEHRLTKPNHPWTNGQVERMNRTLKDATVKRYHYENHPRLRAHLQNFVNAYNYARRLKTLKGLTPFEHIVQCWTKEPKRFKINPTHHTPGLYT